MMDKIKIVIADDHPITIEGLKVTIEKWDDFVVINTANNGQELLSILENTPVDIALIDIRMPVLDGIETIRIIKNKYPNVRTVALSTFDDVDTISRSIEAGCDGFLLKVIESNQLRQALLSVMNGINVVDKAALEILKNKEKFEKECKFSERELQILEYICNGDSNKEIAAKLSLQVGTVKNIVSLMLSKSYCVSRAALTRFALDNHLVKTNK